MQKKLDQYKKECQEEKGTIDSIKKLKTKGITTGDIKRWEYTIRNYSKSVAEFDDSIKTLDDVVSITNKFRAKINDLKTNIAKKRGQNDALDKEILEKESKLAKLDEQISNTIKIQFEKITKNTAHTISKVRSLLDFHDVEIKSKRNKYLDVFNDDLKNIVHDIQNELRELTLIANVDGKFSFCEPLYILTTEGKGEKNKVYLCMISLLTGLELWLKNSNSSYPLQSHTRHLKNVFEESLSKHTIAS